ncbi:hypothetical protein Fcan01_23251 [Folsomia candida]|uniref:Uncharacterized protein n=1 Tax=Folsomia candida TaxID=158441 RepID=A0A226D9Z0_FOLCA|nr:hypothetical protein Fcan01_23251 [Folsomia candida]
MVAQTLLEKATDKMILILPIVTEGNQLISETLKEGSQLMEKYAESEEGSETRGASINHTAQNEIFKLAQTAEKEVYEILHKFDEIEEIHKKHRPNALQHVVEKQREDVSVHSKIAATSQLPFLEDIDLEFLQTEKDEEERKNIMETIQNQEDRIFSMVATTEAFRQVFSIQSVASNIRSRTLENKKVSLSKYQTYQGHVDTFQTLMEDRLVDQEEFRKFRKSLEELLKNEKNGNEIEQNLLKEEL